MHDVGVEFVDASQNFAVRFQLAQRLAQSWFIERKMIHFRMHFVSRRALKWLRHDQQHIVIVSHRVDMTRAIFLEIVSDPSDFHFATTS